MPSYRIIIPVLGALLGFLAWYASRGSYVTSTWPRVYGIGTFILVYVLGNILVGVAQGMREARQARATREAAARAGVTRSEPARAASGHVPPTPPPPSTKP